jgi:hypothetical protein
VNLDLFNSTSWLLGVRRKSHSNNCRSNGGGYEDSTDNSITVDDIELFISCYDSYDIANCKVWSLDTGHGWDSYQTSITNMYQPYPYTDGTLYVSYIKYIYDNIPPIYCEETLIPPGCNAFSSNGLETERISLAENQSTRISEYFSAFPNPTSNSMTIEFYRTDVSRLSICIYDFAGRLINTLADNLSSMQTHSIIWNLDDSFGNRVPIGLYYISIISENRRETRAVVVI